MVDLPRLDSLAAATDRAFLACLSARETGISRAQIAAETGISKPAISDAALRLRAARLIREVGLETGRRGRVATLLQVNPDRGHSIGISLDSREVRLHAQDLCRTTIDSQRHALTGDESPQTVTQLMQAMLEHVTTRVGSERLAITASTADPVNYLTGEVVALPHTPFPAGHFNVAKAISATDANASPTSICVDNDVNWATLAEADARRKTHAETTDFLFVHLGAGIGGGIYLDGKVRRGARGLVGELGYTRVADGRDLTQAVAALGFGGRGEYGLDVAAVRNACEENPRPEAINAVFDLFAGAIANACMLLNPDTVVIGGPVAESSTFVTEVARRVRDLTIDPPKVVASGLGPSAPLEGASLDAHRRARASLGF